MCVYTIYSSLIGGSHHIASIILHNTVTKPMVPSVVKY